MKKGIAISIVFLISCAKMPEKFIVLPDAPTLSSPSKGSTISDNTPYFDWGSVSDASVYELVVDNSSSFSSPNIQQSSLSSSDYTATSSLSDGTYYWRVRCKDSQGNWGVWSGSWSFTIDTQGPSAPTLSSPSNGSTISDNTPYFNWGDMSEASYYELVVENSSSFSSPNIQHSSLSSSDYTATSSLSDGTYYWKVRAKDSQGNWGAWSGSWSFTIDTQGPGAPTLSSPSNGSTVSDNTPYFDWSSVSDASVYELVVDNSSSFSSPNIQNSSLTSSDYTATGSLSDGTYYWRVRCKDSQGNWGGWSGSWSFTISTFETGTVTDIDGNVYQTVKIGNQWWMAENLKVTHYRNGDAISNVTGNTSWSNLSTGAYCNYKNDASYAATYGRLYNWYAVHDSRNIAPAGWHVPTDAEWQTLVDYLGGSSVAGGKMKEAGTTHWASPNTGATNASSFSALPGGYRNYYYGTFGYLGSVAYFWSSTDYISNDAWYRGLRYDISGIGRSYNYKQYGYSVRCVRD